MGDRDMSEAAAPVQLDEWLCLALYSASRAMTARYRPALSKLGLTYPQYLVLVLLWQDGPCSVGHIGLRLNLDSSTLSPLLKRLEAMGLLTRTRDTRDERSVTVQLTEQGRLLETEAAEVPAQICAATGLAPAEQTRLVAELGSLTARLQTSADAATASS